MHLTLIRIYGNSGTNGYLIHDKKVVSKTIELPWRNNRRSESCIPEGLYTLRDRYSPHFGRHLEIMDVPGRDLILFHPANDASRQLRGCIAPVTELVGPGLGNHSRQAMQRLMNLVLPVIDRNHAIHRVALPDPEDHRGSCNHAIHRVARIRAIHRAACPNANLRQTDPGAIHRPVSPDEGPRVELTLKIQT